MLGGTLGLSQVLPLVLVGLLATSNVGSEAYLGPAQLVAVARYAVAGRGHRRVMRAGCYVGPTSR